MCSRRWHIPGTEYFCTLQSPYKMAYFLGHFPHPQCLRSYWAAFPSRHTQPFPVNEVLAFRRRPHASKMCPCLLHTSVVTPFLLLPDARFYGQPSCVTIDWFASRVLFELCAVWAVIGRDVTDNCPLPGAVVSVCITPQRTDWLLAKWPCSFAFPAECLISSCFQIFHSWQCSALLGFGLFVGLWVQPSNRQRLTTVLVAACVSLINCTASCMCSFACHVFFCLEKTFHCVGPSLIRLFSLVLGDF